MTTLYHELAGSPDAPPLLLGGSLGTDLGMWDGQLELAERFHLVRFDHRGHGGSPAPPGPYAIPDLGRDVIALMDTLDLVRASFCGLSIGGMVGMWLAAEAPERIDRLILLCTTARMPNGAAYAERAAFVREAGDTAPIADAVVARWLTPGYAAAHPPECARLEAMLLATSAEGYAGCCEAIAGMDLSARLPRIIAPTLIISGADDPATPPALQAKIAEAVPGARHEIVGPAAHLASVEQPALVNQLIGEFLG
jgi:3-oxoadipate enol-lactonase